MDLQCGGPRITGSVRFIPAAVRLTATPMIQAAVRTLVIGVRLKVEAVLHDGNNWAKGGVKASFGVRSIQTISGGIHAYFCPTRELGILTPRIVLDLELSKG